MDAAHNNTVRPRLAFMLVMAIAISCVFFWVIGDFVVALFVSAVLAGLLHPFYLRINGWVGGRRQLATDRSWQELVHRPQDVRPGTSLVRPDLAAG